MILLKKIHILPFLLLASLMMASLSSSAQAQITKPYDIKLVRLTEILGAVHYLRELCGADEGQKWRKKMKELIDVEGSSARRRSRLVKSFNHGYRGYRRTYRKCTKPAVIAISRFMDEGEKLASQIVNENK